MCKIPQEPKEYRHLDKPSMISLYSQHVKYWDGFCSVKHLPHNFLTVPYMTGLLFNRSVQTGWHSCICWSWECHFSHWFHTSPVGKTGLYSNVISTSIQHTKSGKWLIGKQYWKAKISKSWGVPAVIQWAQTVHSHLHCSSQLKGKGESSTQGLGKACIWLGPGRLEYTSNSEIFYFNL